MVLLSRDISLNKGPVCKYQLLNTTEWNIFKTNGLHLVHININSLLPKIDKLRHISSKLDKSITTLEIPIDNYDLLRCDRG